ncbi:MAG: helix-turn-helix domain-containing protein [Enterocloster citroniae]|nr:helix-turn-helix domain-containing protein [Enterocloster citroniae]
MGYFSRIYAEDLPHRAKTVYMYLKDRSNQSGQCYPAIGTIAKELHLSRRTVERAINDLIYAGLLTKEQRWRKNGGRSSLLFTLIEPPDTS